MSIKRTLILAIAAPVFLLATAAPVLAEEMAQESFNKMMDAFLEDDANLEKLGTALEQLYKKKQASARQQQAVAEQERVEDQFKNPVKIELGKSPAKGPEGAKIIIVEFSDFQCPFCRKGSATAYQVLEEYPKDVKIVFKHLPLPFHPEAKPAAQASIAAQNQGKFWEMHDALFENQAALGEETYMRLAEEIGLDMDKFKKDLADPETAKMVENDAATATKLGVRGTPGFFINGVQLSGAQPLPKFKEIIDRWLEK